MRFEGCINLKVSRDGVIAIIFRIVGNTEVSRCSTVESQEEIRQIVRALYDRGVCLRPVRVWGLAKKCVC